MAWTPPTDDELVARIKLPKAPQIFGLVEQRCGGSRMKVKCFDGKERLCSIPGKLKKRLWVREGDIVVVEPWEFEGDIKGNVVFKYRPVQVKWLKSHNYLTYIEDLDEF